MKSMSKKVMKHLKEDIHEGKEAMSEDRELLKDMKAKYMKKKCTKCGHESAMKRKMKKVFKEAKEHKLRVGSKTGPIAKKRSQILAIALSEGRKAEGKQISRTMKKNKK